MKNLKHQAIATILENGTDFIQSRVEKYIERYKRSQAINSELRDLTENDIEYYKLAIKFSLIKALGNYLLSDDKIIKNEFMFGAKGVEIILVIERDGKRHQLITDVIIAEGEIQCAHYRYLVKTSLNKLGVDLTKRLKEIDLAQSEVVRYENYVERLKQELAKLEATTYETVKAKAFSFWTERGHEGPAWNLLNEGAKEIYESEEKYLAKFEKEIQETLSHIPASIKWKKKDIIKETAMLEKKREKLEAIIASKG